MRRAAAGAAALVLGVLGTVGAWLQVAGASTALSSVVVTSPAAGYRVVAQGPLDASAIGTSAPDPAQAGAALSRLAHDRSLTTYEREWKNGAGTNEIQDVMVHFATAAAAEDYFVSVKRSLASAEIMTSGTL
ncbi:MAG TPA: hypothetical protein VL961_07235, partial [Acidimicrobiales bacterium]|nr:hypothetical protein [Acidimicrobiales bacterium]